MDIDWVFVAGLVATVLTLVGAIYGVLKWRYAKTISHWSKMPDRIDQILNLIYKSDFKKSNVPYKNKEVESLIMDALRNDTKNIRDQVSFECFVNRLGVYLMFMYPDVTRISIITPPDISKPPASREKNPDKLIITHTILGSDFSKKEKEWSTKEKNEMGIPGLVYKGSQSVYICNDITKDQNFIQGTVSELEFYPYLSMATARICFQQNCYGVLSVCARTPNFWDPDDEKIIERFSSLLGIAFNTLDPLLK